MEDEKLLDKMLLENLDDEGSHFFRITRPDDNLQGGSVDGPSVSRVEAAERFGCDPEDLDEALEDHDMFYDDITNTTRFFGVCAIDNVEELAEYWKNGMVMHEGTLEVVVFDGDIVGDCVDGDVVYPHEIIHRFAVGVLRHFI